MTLNETQQEKLSNYVDSQLLTDLNLFEESYGYRGNRFLAYWLILNKVFPEDLEFTARSGMYYILYDTNPIPFLDSITHRKALQKHFVANHDIGSSILLFTPFLKIATDGRGGCYYATFFEENNDIFVYDHDPEEFVKLPKNFVSLIKRHRIKKIFPLLEKIVEDHADRLDFKSIKNKPKKPRFSVNQLKKGREWSNLLYMMRGLMEIKPFYKRKANGDTSSRGFDEHEIIERNFWDKRFNDYTYNDFRAISNPIVIRNYYWYYFTGQMYSLKISLKHTKNIQGKYYQAIRQAFEELINENNKQLLFTYEQVEKIRYINGLEIKKYTKKLKEQDDSKKFTLEETTKHRMEVVLKLKSPTLELRNAYVNVDIFSSRLHKPVSTEMLKFYFPKYSFLENLSIYNYPLEIIPSEIEHLKKLKKLGLFSIGLNEIPKEIGQLQNLESLTISDMRLEKLPKEIGLLTNLKSLSLKENQFKELPKEIGQLKNLELLYLNKNQLSFLPKEISNLTKLNSICLSDNNFEIFPEIICNFSNLAFLFIDNNQIKKLPKEIGMLKKMKTFKAQHNQIEQIPKEFGQAKQLSSIVLYNNKISSLPIELTTLSKLVSLDLRENQFIEYPKEVAENLSYKKALVIE